MLRCLAAVLPSGGLLCISSCVYQFVLLYAKASPADLVRLLPWICTFVYPVTMVTVCMDCCHWALQATGNKANA